ncbi:MAG: hypothetical protein LBS27_08235 [Bifidobacteriaceae bacterium]|jgi:hypothetical protein|nr:hypothetical protein [Bifidobacteriaceae bacterium]
MTSTSTPPGADKAPTPAKSDGREAPAQTAKRGLTALRPGQLRQLVLISAIVASVVALATCVFALVSSTIGAREASGASQDQKLVTLLNSVNQADRALYTERSDWVTAHITAKSPDPDAVDKALVGADEAKDEDDAVALGTAAKAFGIDAMKLADKGSDKQFRLLVEDPAGRIAEARAELTTGHVSGAEECAEPDGPCQATFNALRAALYAFATKAPSLFNDPVLAPQAEAFARAMGDPEMSIPVRIDQDVPAGDTRAAALDTLVRTADTAAEQTDKLPVVLWAAGGALVLVAAALWVVYWRKGPQWAAQVAAAAPPAARAATSSAQPPAGAPPAGQPRAKRLPWARGPKATGATKAAQPKTAAAKAAAPADQASRPAPTPPAGAAATANAPASDAGAATGRTPEGPAKKRRVPFAPTPAGPVAPGGHVAPAGPVAPLAPAAPAATPARPAGAGAAAPARPAAPTETKAARTPSAPPVQSQRPSAPAKPAAAPAPAPAAAPAAQAPAAPAPATATPEVAAPTDKPASPTKAKPAGGKPRVPWRSTGNN